MMNNSVVLIIWTTTSILVLLTSPTQAANKNPCANSCLQSDHCENRTRPVAGTKNDAPPRFSQKIVGFLMSRWVSEEGCLVWDHTGRINPEVGKKLNKTKLMVGQGENETCDGQTFCRSLNTNTTGFLCYNETHLACNQNQSSGNGQCQVLPDPPFAVDFVTNLTYSNVTTGCLTEEGKAALESVVATRFGGQDGHQLHREYCEPFDDTDPSKRCKLVSKACPNCWRPTHLSCDPILHLCLCKTELEPEVSFQFGNHSQVCYVRPTMQTVDGYVCTQGTVVANVTTDSDHDEDDEDSEICKCESRTFHLTFNSVNDDWWSCDARMTHSPTMSIIIISATLLLILGR